jgi:xylulokinase
MRVAGIDCAARVTRIVVCDAETGEVVRRSRAPHQRTAASLRSVEEEIDPRAWLLSLGEAATGGVLDGVEAIGITAQQHGMVPLDGNGGLVRPALLHQDRRDSGAAADLLAELGGREGWIRELGTVPEAGWTAAKLRWLAREEPDSAARIAQVLLPHDWLNWQLTGRGHRCTTDRGDASGTGYWSPGTGRWRPDLVELALGHETVLPHVLDPTESAGRTAEGVLVSAGTGETMATALGLDLAPGDAVVSLAGGGTAFALHGDPLAEPPGQVTPFADATGGFLPLVQTHNAGLVLHAAAELLGTDQPGLMELARRSAPGARGLTLLPYLDGERTPDLPYAAGTLSGLRVENMRPEHLARAAVEGLLCGMAEALDLLRREMKLRRVVLLGKPAHSTVIQELAPAVFGTPVLVPSPAQTTDYASIGAARQAAWALREDGAQGPANPPPKWTPPAGTLLEPAPDPTDADGPAIRDQYRRARDRAHPELLKEPDG